MSFDDAFALVVGLEAGYVNDPHDPGGETKFGISKRAYPNLDIPQLTLEQAKAIYERDYWGKCGCGLMAWPVALQVFDAAANQGPGFAKGLDGSALDMAVARALRYVNNPHFDIYGKGWLHRLFTIFQAGCT